MSPATAIRRGSRLLTPAARHRLKEASAAAMSYRHLTPEASAEDETWAVEVLSLLYGDRLLAVAWLGVMLAGCHRHDEATALLTRVIPHRRRVRADAMFRHMTHRLDTYAPRHPARHHDGQPCPHPACLTGREPLSPPLAASDRLEILR